MRYIKCFLVLAIAILTFSDTTIYADEVTSITAPPTPTPTAIPLTPVPDKIITPTPYPTTSIPSIIDTTFDTGVNINVPKYKEIGWKFAGWTLTSTNTSTRQYALANSADSYTAVQLFNNRTFVNKPYVFWRNMTTTPNATAKFKANYEWSNECYPITFHINELTYVLSDKVTVYLDNTSIIESYDADTFTLFTSTTNNTGGKGSTDVETAHQKTYSTSGILPVLKSDGAVFAGWGISPSATSTAYTKLPLFSTVYQTIPALNLLPTHYRRNYTLHLYAIWKNVAIKDQKDYNMGEWTNYIPAFNTMAQDYTVGIYNMEQSLTSLSNGNEILKISWYPPITSLNDTMFISWKDLKPYKNNIILNNGTDWINKTITIGSKGTKGDANVKNLIVSYPYQGRYTVNALSRTYTYLDEDDAAQSDYVTINYTPVTFKYDNTSPMINASINQIKLEDCLESLSNGSTPILDTTFTIVVDDTAKINDSFVFDEKDTSGIKNITLNIYKDNTYRISSLLGSFDVTSSAKNITLNTEGSAPLKATYTFAMDFYSTSPYNNYTDLYFEIVATDNAGTNPNKTITRTARNEMNDEIGKIENYTVYAELYNLPNTLSKERYNLTATTDDADSLCYIQAGEPAYFKLWTYGKFPDNKIMVAFDATVKNESVSENSKNLIRSLFKISDLTFNTNTDGSLKTICGAYDWSTDTTAFISNKTENSTTFVFPRYYYDYCDPTTMASGFDKYNDTYPTHDFSIAFKTRPDNKTIAKLKYRLWDTVQNDYKYTIIN